MIKNAKLINLCVIDHLALCFISYSTLRAMEIPPCWSCLKKFWDHSIHQCTEMLNMRFGYNPNGVSDCILTVPTFACWCMKGSPLEQWWKWQFHFRQESSSYESVCSLRATITAFQFYYIYKMTILVYLN